MIKKSFGAVLTGTPATIYTVPTGKKAEWVLMYLKNSSGSTGTAEVDFTDASASATLPILDGYSLSSKEFFQIGGGFNEFIMMEEGDSISASASQTMTILVSVIEYNDIIQGV